MKKVLFFTKKDGFTTVEILLAFALLSVVIVSIITITISATASISDSNEASVGTLLAEEAFEVVRNLRDDDFANLTDGTFGLGVNINAEWELVPTPDVTDGYTRTIQIQTVDTFTKQVNVAIDWQPTTGVPKQINFVQYYKDIFRFGGLGAGSWATPGIQVPINLNGSNDGLNLILEGNILYLIRNSSNPDFFIYDVTDPLNLIELGGLNIRGNAVDIEKVGNVVYAVGTNREIISIDVSNLNNPTVLDEFNLPRNTDMLSVSPFGSNYIFSTREQRGNSEEIYVHNTSNPSNLTQEYSANYSDDINETRAYGNYVFGGTSSNSQELLVFDVSTPASTSIVASLNLAGSANVLSLTVDSGNEILYVGRDDGDIHVIDISTPTSPVEIGEYTSDGEVTSMDYAPSLDFVFAGYSNSVQNFQVIDVGNPANPLPYGQFPDFNGNLDIQYDPVLNVTWTANSNNTSELIVYEPD